MADVYMDKVLKKSFIMLSKNKAVDDIYDIIMALENQ